MVNSRFITDDDLNDWIDLSVASLAVLLTAAYGEDYFAQHCWLQVFPGGDPNIAWPKAYRYALGANTGYPCSYALPSNFRKLSRVHYFLGDITAEIAGVGTTGAYSIQPTGDWLMTTGQKTAWPMHRLDVAGQVMDYTPRAWEQTRVAYRLRYGPIMAAQYNGHSGIGGVPLYDLVTHNGAALDFLPVPSQRYAVQVTYVPKPMLLPQHPFIEYVIADCAAQCKEQEENDSSAQRAEQSRVVMTIGEDKSPDAANPPMVVDVYGRNRLPGDGWPWPG